MAIVRINLGALGYPNVAPNSLLVLQSLSAEGHKLVLRNVYYRNKQQIIDYFHDRNLKIAFLHTNRPDIDIKKNQALIYGEVVEGEAGTLWENIDLYCLEKGLYQREENHASYIPYYKEGFFVVVDYGLSTQMIDSKPISLKAAHTKGSKLFKANPAIQTIDLVNAETFEVVEHYDTENKCFVPATETVFFSIAV